MSTVQYVKLLNKRAIYIEALVKAIVFLKKPICFFFLRQAFPLLTVPEYSEENELAGGPRLPLSAARSEPVLGNRMEPVLGNRMEPVLNRPGGHQLMHPCSPPVKMRSDPQVYRYPTILHRLTCDLLAFFFALISPEFESGYEPDPEFDPQSSVADPWHIVVDPDPDLDPRIHASEL